MQSTQDVTTNHEYRNIPIAALAESPTNPRKRFDEKTLGELGEPTYTIASIAARAGKSEAYVHGRIKLADLIPPVAEAFLKGKITIGHALLIAKLPDSQQQEAFNAAFRGMWTTDGNSQVLIPVRELSAWIESNILLQLASARSTSRTKPLFPPQVHGRIVPSAP